jgi:hypothetical protein
VVVGAVWRSRARRPAPIGGLLLSAAGVIALTSSAPLGAPVPEGLGGGLVLLAVGAVVAELTPWAFLRVVFPVPGAVLLATDSGLPDVTWIRVLVGITAVVGGALAADFDKRHTRPSSSVALPLLAVSAVGVYYTVPDTEQALVLLAACLVVAVAAWPLALVSLGSAGAYASVGLLAWVAAVGGIGRHSSIIGGVACLALLVAEPLSRGVTRRRWGSSRLFGKGRGSVVVAGLAQLAFVIFGSRVVGLLPSVAEAVVVALLELAVAMVALRALASRRTPATR